MKVVAKESPVEVFGGWEVYRDGSLQCILKTASGRETRLHIYPDRLSEPDLLLSLMADKVTEEWNNLMPAFMLACRLAGVTSVTIRTDFE